MFTEEMFLLASHVLRFVPGSQSCSKLSPRELRCYCIREEGKKSESRSVVSNSLWPHGLYSPWNSPGQNTGVGSLSILPGRRPRDWTGVSCISGRLFTNQAMREALYEEDKVEDNKTLPSQNTSFLVTLANLLDLQIHLQSVLIHKKADNYYAFFIVQL